jgi:hypothetical protein
VIGHAEARAETCTPPTPACHLENGKDLLNTDPKRAAEELLASYKLDERTDTLVLYATALALDGRYALALETWKRVIVFRESEVNAAKEAARKATGRKLAAARAAAARAQKQSEQAADAIIKLWPHIGRVHIKFADGQQLAVTHDGVEVDISHDVLVNAGHDELVFTRKDGSVERVAVTVAAGALEKIDAPPGVAAKPAPQPPRPEPPKPVEPAAPVEAPRTPPMPVRLVDEPRSRTLSRVGLGLVVGSVVVGGVAGTLGYLAGRDYDDSRTSGCSSNGQCPFGPAADQAQRSNDRARLAQISAIGAGALAAAGVTLWFYGRGKAHHAVTDISLHVGPSSTAISGRF